VITAYGLLLTVHVALGVRARTPPRPLVMATMLAAAATALYTAFLFGQSKGRELWQSPLLAPHLIVQAMAAGAALVAPSWLRFLLPINGLLIAGEVWGRHATEDARRAAQLIEADIRFSTGVLAIGHLLPLALLWLMPSFEAAAGSLALTGLLLWEHLYVQAPQRIPNA
jgi:formate-dependent nitrite reductase membrane component NrfD